MLNCIDNKHGATSYVPLSRYLLLYRKLTQFKIKSIIKLHKLLN